MTHATSQRRRGVLLPGARIQMILGAPANSHPRLICGFDAKSASASTSTSTSGRLSAATVVMTCPSCATGTANGAVCRGQGASQAAQQKTEVWPDLPRHGVGIRATGGICSPPLRARALHRHILACIFVGPCRGPRPPQASSSPPKVRQ